ncbi:histidine kinase [Microcoleus anatoxicus]|uniref:Histidine kinase n=1 Tax=Microcoleus anatoxicus PTRS2 TaxID=2705321 RepID=A0ABU8YK58_9CYAN|nr:MAG: histidine kinase [Oscillatoriales cyanobacterium]
MYNQTPFTLINLAKCSLVLRQLGRNSGSMQETSQKIADYIYQHFYDSESSQNSCVLVRLFKTHPYGELDDSLQASARSLMQNKIPPYEMKCWTLLASAGKEPQCNYADEAPNIVIPLVNEELVAQMLPISERILELGLDIPTVLGIADEKMLEMELKLLNIFYICSAQNSPFIAEQNSLVIPYEVKSVLGIGGLLPSGSLFMVELFFNIKISFKIAEVLNILAVAVKTALLPFDGEVVFNNSPNTPIVMATNKIVPREILEASQLIGLSRVLDFYQEEMVRHASRLQSIIGKLKDKVDERHKQPF